MHLIPVVARPGTASGRRESGRGLAAGDGTSGKDGAGREEEVEPLFPHLEEVLRVELDGWGAGSVGYALDKTAVLAEDLEGEAATREVVEDAGVAAGYAHAAADGGEVDVHLRRLAVAAQHDRVRLHVVLEVVALEFGEPNHSFLGGSDFVSAAAPGSVASALSHRFGNRALERAGYLFWGEKKEYLPVVVDSSLRRSFRFSPSRRTLT